MDSSPPRWADFAERLRPERTYWLATTLPSGAPHVVPIWGVVVGSTLYFYSERRTRKARNLAADPRLALHLASGDDVVIVHGWAEDLGAPGASVTVVRALDDKYSDPGDAGYLPSADPDFDVLWALHPTSAMSWNLDAYDTSQVRWSSSPRSGVS